MKRRLLKMEGYFEKELKEKAGRLIFFTILLLIPNFHVRVFASFIIIASLLPSDVRSGRVSMLYALPFSRNELYWYSYGLAAVLATSTFFIGEALSSYANTFSLLLKNINFVSAYYGIIMLCVSAGLDNFGFPLLLLFGDAVLGGMGNNSWRLASFNPYSLISPLYQRNLLFSTIFALALLFASWYVFKRKGGAR